MKIIIYHERISREVNGSFVLHMSREDAKNMARQMNEKLLVSNGDTISIHIKSKESEEKSRLKNWCESA